MRLKLKPHIVNTVREVGPPMNAYFHYPVLTATLVCSWIRKGTAGWLKM